MLQRDADIRTFVVSMSYQVMTQLLLQMYLLCLRCTSGRRYRCLRRTGGEQFATLHRTGERALLTCQC